MSLLKKLIGVLPTRKYVIVVSVMLLLSSSILGFASYAKKAPKLGQWVCWATPTPDTLQKCRKAGTCSGAGVYAWANRKLPALVRAMTLCQYEYEGICYLDYCERFTTNQISR